MSGLFIIAASNPRAKILSLDELSWCDANKHYVCTNATSWGRRPLVVTIDSMNKNRSNGPHGASIQKAASGDGR